MKGFDGGSKYGVKPARCEVGRKSAASQSKWYFVHNRSRYGKWTQPRKRGREIAEAFTEEDARLNGVRRVCADCLCSRVTDTPHKTDRYQRFVLIVAVGFVLETNIGFVEA